MAKSKFFRIFTEGDTTDGRVIQRNWIEEMAKTYNPELYGARIWVEHIRGMGPDSIFGAYGDVVAVKADQGVGGKLALYAQIDPTPELIAMNKKRQKVYTSAEIDPDFAKTGKCYLTGLAVTDSPASLGTEMLAFAAQASANPLAARKQSPGNLFTAAQETVIEFEEDTMTTQNNDASLVDQIKALFTKQEKPTDTKPDAANADTTAALLELGKQFAGFSKQFTDAGQATATELKTITDKLTASETAFTELKAAHDKLLTDFTALVGKLDSEEGGGQTRPPATGGKGGAGDKPDCL